MVKYYTGQEYILDKLSGETFTLILHNQSKDSLTADDGIEQVDNEASGSNYSRQTDTFTSGESGAWYLDNDNEVVFDISDSPETIDNVLICQTFQSDDEGESSSNLNIIAECPLDQDRNQSDDVDKIKFNAGNLGITF